MALELDLSQQSQSSIESTASRASERRPVSTGHSPTGRHTRLLRGTTPSTSLSDQSSQERAESVSPVYRFGIGGSETMLADLSGVSQHSLGLSNPGPASIEGGSPRGSQAPKRTASGQFKVHENKPRENVKGVDTYGHSRNTSTASKSSQVSDLSHALRTRLSYAMFKVQNGWQSHNLNELEAMALPKASNSSAITPLNHAKASPSSPAPRPQHRSEELPAEQTSPANSRITHDPLYPRKPLNSHSLHQIGTAEGPSGQKQPARSAQEAHPPQMLIPQGPSLAPPVDILPRNSRVLHAPNVQLPSLKTDHVIASGSMNPASPAGPPYGPTTPPKRPAAAIRTPMEKDAVETLMFMSSPGNSGHYPAFHGDTSPVLIRSAMSPKRVDFTPAISNRQALSPRKTFHLSPDRLATKADVDRLLDEMPNHYSSSDDDGPFA
ncbi:MAG: hypothetical protein Q9170_003642 [Blastenia crenularia]